MCATRLRGSFARQQSRSKSTVTGQQFNVLFRSMDYSLLATWCLVISFQVLGTCLIATDTAKKHSFTPHLYMIMVAMALQSGTLVPAKQHSLSGRSAT